MTCLFRNITTLSIIDIVDQLLRETESGRVCTGHISSLCGSPVVAKLQGGTFLRKEQPNGRQFVEGMVSYH